MIYKIASSTYVTVEWRAFFFFYRLICDLSKGYTDIVKLLGSAADEAYLLTDF